MKVMIEILDISCFVFYSMKQIDNIDYFDRMFRFVFFICIFISYILLLLLNIRFFEIKKKFAIRILFIYV